MQFLRRLQRGELATSFVVGFRGELTSIRVRFLGFSLGGRFELAEAGSHKLPTLHFFRTLLPLNQN